MFLRGTRGGSTRDRTAAGLFLCAMESVAAAVAERRFLPRGAGVRGAVGGGSRVDAAGNRPASLGWGAAGRSANLVARGTGIWGHDSVRSLCRGGESEWGASVGVVSAAAAPAVFDGAGD